MGKKIYLTIIWLITLFCILVGCNRYVSSFPWSFWGEESYEEVEDFDTSTKRTTKDNGEKGTHKYEQAFTNLIISCDTADITIKDGDEFSCKYKVPSESEYSLEWKPDNEGTAYITQTNDKVINVKGASFVITIPSHVTLSSVSVENAVGDTKINGITVNELSVTCDVGDFEMKKSVAGNMTVDTHTGDVEFKHTEFANLTARCDVGDCKVEDIDLNRYNFNLSAGVGEIEINDVKEKSSYVLDNKLSQNINITCNVGDVEIN